MMSDRKDWVKQRKCWWKECSLKVNQNRSVFDKEQLNIKVVRSRVVFCTSLEMSSASFLDFWSANGTGKRRHLIVSVGNWGKSWADLSGNKHSSCTTCVKAYLSSGANLLIFIPVVAAIWACNVSTRDIDLESKRFKKFKTDGTPVPFDTFGLLRTKSIHGELQNRLSLLDIQSGIMIN